MSLRARSKAELVLRNVGELPTISGHSKSPVKHPNEASLGIIKKDRLCIASVKGLIAFVGNEADMLDSVDASSAVEVDCQGKLVLPGFVDSHTHAMFAGNRAKELTMKLSGMPYLEILRSGGGILQTVKETNRATDEELLYSIRQRLEDMMRCGTTTFEIKSGYALSLEGELRLLRLTRELGSAYDIASTLLSAHALPEEYKGQAKKYVDDVVLPSIATCSERGLADFVDVFLEEGIFDYSLCRLILEAGRNHGLALKIHADEFTDQKGAELASSLGVVSADHLGRASDNGIGKLSHSGVIAVLLPGTMCSSFSESYPHARKMIENGVPVALATDFSPNSWIQSMQYVMSLACYKLRMSPEEAIIGATINSAHAIVKADSVGSIEVGKNCDLVVTDVDNYYELPYRIASNSVTRTIKKGKIVKVN